MKYLSLKWLAWFYLKPQLTDFGEKKMFQSSRTFLLLLGLSSILTLAMNLTNFLLKKGFPPMLSYTQREILSKSLRLLIIGFIPEDLTTGWCLLIAIHNNKQFVSRIEQIFILWSNFAGRFGSEWKIFELFQELFVFLNFFFSIDWMREKRVENITD